MKKICLYVLLSIQYIFLYSQESKDNELSVYINAGKWFEVLDFYNKNSTDFSEFMNLCSSSLISTYFNKPDDAIQSLEILTSKYAQQLGQQNINFAIMLAENYACKQEYDKSAEIYLSLLNQLSPFMSKEELFSFRNNYAKYKALNDIPPFDMIIENKDYLVKISVDEGGIFFNSLIHDKAWKTIFDTGSSINAITKEASDKIGVKVLQDSILLGNSTLCQIGYVDSLFISDILFVNVPFYIFPEEKNVENTKAEQLFDIIIGVSTMKKINEFHLDFKKKELFIPGNETMEGSNKNNFLLISDMPYLQGKIEDESILLLYDSGFNGDLTISKIRNTDLYSKYKPEIKQVRYNTFDRIIEEGYYNYRDLTVEINAIPCLFENVMQGMIPNNNISQYGNGVIGKDIQELFSKVKMNFNNMFIILEK